MTIMTANTVLNTANAAAKPHFLVKSDYAKDRSREWMTEDKSRKMGFA